MKCVLSLYDEISSKMPMNPVSLLLLLKLSRIAPTSGRNR